jgi:enediyne polyketide synthase
LEVIGDSAGPRLVHARERYRVGNEFTYDVQITGASGAVIERWEGLRLRAVERLAPFDVWPEALVGPLLERRIEELGEGAVVGVIFGRASLRSSKSRAHRSGAESDGLLRRALGTSDRLWHRADGKPELESGKSVSVAHADEFTLAVAGEGRLGCDVEPIISRSASIWRDLLGPERFKLATRISSGKSFDEAATRLWNATECLKKTGLPPDAPLVLDADPVDGWVLFRSGSLTIATWIAAIRGAKAPLAFALAFDTAIKAASRSSAEVLA